MMNFTVNQEKCNQCGMCGKDCPVLIIDCKSGFPTIKEGKEKNCLKCQHCLAICSQGAISIFGKDPKNSIPTSVDLPNSEALENLMKNRRSVRKFKQDEIDKSLIHSLLASASYAPTAKNENSVHLSVVDKKTGMQPLKELIYQTIQDKFEAGEISSRFQYLSNFSKVWFAKGIDVIFRDAPHVVIASAPEDGTSPDLDCTIALSYFELLANSNNVATLWDGFAANVLEDVAPELKEKVGVPAGNKVGMVMIFGHSARKYARSIQHEGENINTLSL
ncbi:nitroreductase family protein [Halosquirtibacter xylanolyticus]|uniref:nitroreductase family protein n=1 Tax=Halosquirtibacter xylanolyticus TaxID=3374599 RepID=UPI003747FA51|nr:nitroreductase family protein [Prolixibacteraceae bacterium]